MFRRDRPQKAHGGLLIYVKNTLKSRRRYDLEDTSIKYITIEISSVRMKQIFSVATDLQISRQ